MPKDVMDCCIELDQENRALRKTLEAMAPKPHWPEWTKSLIQRLQGIYAIGPEAAAGVGEFGYRTFEDRPAIQLEAAHRLAVLEDRVFLMWKQLEELLVQTGWEPEQIEVLRTEFFD